MPASADLSSLAASVAHELVTPLAIIASATSLLERDDGQTRPPEELDEIVATIRRNVSLAQVVVESLRNLDEDGSDVEVRPQQVHLSAFVRTTVGDLERTILRDHPTTVVAGDGDLVVDVDPVRLRQVLFNLLSNAAKFSPAGHQVTIRLEASDRAARLVVEDDGRGIAPGDADRIFRKWERIDDDTTGLGLGLHLSRAIARAHGGELTLAETNGGRGAVFVVTLPRSQPSDHDGPAVARR